MFIRNAWYIAAWADERRRLRVRANADTPADARRARELGAEGIGLCRTEHMFMSAERLPVVRRFGAIEARVGPGMHYGMPWPVDCVDVLKTTSVMKIGVGFNLRENDSESLKGVELLTGDEARSRFGWVPDDVVQARFRQGDGLIEPKRVAMGLLEGSSADVITGVGVTGFEVSSGRLTTVVTDHGTIATGAAVIAAGPLSELLTRPAGVELPVSAVRRQRVVLWDVPEVPRDAPMTVDEETTSHWRPVASGAYLLYPDASEPGAEPVENVTADPGFALALLDPFSPIAIARTATFWRDVWERAGSACSCPEASVRFQSMSGPCIDCTTRRTDGCSTSIAIRTTPPGRRSRWISRATASTSRCSSRRGTRRRKARGFIFSTCRREGWLCTTSRPTSGARPRSRTFAARATSN
jgi:glycine/D-amino acid oxidase-like deaminating enzyme